MEALRWILLGVGVFFVLFIYFLGRSRRSTVYDSNEIESEDLPEFSANNWNDVDDDIADVHISAREVSEEEYLSSDDEYDFDNDDTCEADNLTEDIMGDDLSDAVQGFDEDSEESNKISNTQTIIVLMLISRDSDGLHGDKINSVALANNLKYGYMNIFHRLGGDAKPLFSLANMVEPGSFDPQTIHELRTPGLTYFMQLPVFGSASDALSDMLQCAYRMSELLNADLCDKHKQLLTESEAEKLREIAKHYDSE